MKDAVFQTGNTFSSQSVSLGHARKVWRRIEEQLPGTGNIKNVSEFVNDGLIRSGMALAYDTTSGADAKDFKAITWADIVSAENIDSLNIVGFMQEDAPIVDENTIATCTVIVKGEIYGYMLGDTPEQATIVASKIKTMTQNNGMSIRVVD